MLPEALSSEALLPEAVRDGTEPTGTIQERRREFAGCAAICRQLGEPLIGTAPTAAVGWLLIEHPGPWPAFGLPPDVPASLVGFANLALEHGVRTQLIRRPNRTGRQIGDPAVLLGGGEPGRRWLERRTVADSRALDDLDPARIACSAPPGFGDPVEAALLVCTHGRREVCCAKFGRPVAGALAARFEPMVWETTHVGGDRFAANLVVLPSGAYYGRLDPDDAVRVAEAALDGRLELDWFRGHAGRPEAVQAAECLLRRALDAVEESAVQYIEECDDDHAAGGEIDGLSARRGYRIHRVRFSVSGLGTHTVTLARHNTNCPRLTSCGAATFEAPTGYRLLGISRPLTNPVTPVQAPKPALAITSGG